MELFKLWGSIGLRDEEARSGLKNIDGEAQGTGNRIMNTFKKVGGVIVAALAVDKLKDFGVSAVEAAAKAEAMNAQFEQVFDGIADGATKSMNKIAEETGMLPNRLKGSFTQMAAFAKTTGMKTADALSLTERATRAAADSAAFYDKSIESASESLQSFLKGNYANDAALGISATETTRNAKANELYSKSFKDLDEAQKQLTLLAMVEDGNKLSGALGQAARESEAWENQIGNVKQAWEDFKAKLATPFLDPVVKGMKGLSEFVSGIDVGKIHKAFEVAGSYLSATFGPIVQDAKWFLEDLWAAFKDSGGIEHVQGILENLKGGFQFLSEVIQAFHNTLMSVWYDTGESGDILAKIGISPEAAAKIESILTAIKGAVTQVFGVVVGFLKDKFAEIKAFWETDGAQIMQAFKNVFSGIMAVIQFIMPVILFLVKSVWDNIKGVIDGALKIIMGVLKIFAGLFTGDFGKMWEGVKQLFFGALQFLWNLFSLLMIGKLLGGIKAFIMKGGALFKTFGSAVKGTFKNFIDDVITLFNYFKATGSSIWRAIVDTIKNIIKLFVNAVKSNFKGILDNATNTFKLIKNAITNPIKTAKDVVKGFIDEIKGFFKNMKLKLPNIKMPKFKIKNWSSNPKDWLKAMPSLGIDWYATGTNFATGGMAVVGERGPELIHLPRGSKVNTANETKKSMGNTFNFEGMMKGAQFIVREEADIEKIAKKLNDHIRMSARGKGVVM